MAPLPSAISKLLQRWNTATHTEFSRDTSNSQESMPIPRAADVLDTSIRLDASYSEKNLKGKRFQDYSSRLDEAYAPHVPKIHLKHAFKLGIRDVDYSSRLDEAYDYPKKFHHAVVKRQQDHSGLLPAEPSVQLATRSFPITGKWNPGQGSKDPNTINNNGYFVLFALIGAGMVLTSIWFFFWAKNGGFRWRSGDWDDYKSTVLRRKGPDGRTLTGATKTTMLGQQSIAGTFDLEKQEMREVRNFVDNRRTRTRKQQGAGNREPSDEDVRAYRQEKPARVGGLNRDHDGSHWGDSMGLDGSEAMTEASDRPLHPMRAAQSPKRKGFVEKKRERKQEKRELKEAQRTKDALRGGAGIGNISRPKKTRPHSFATADDLVADPSERYGSSNGNNHNNYYSAYRPQPPRHASPQRHTPRYQTTRQPSPPKRSQTPKYPGSFDAYSDAGDSDTGTKIYSHHIPAVGRGTRDAGFRRGGGAGRRDSLSDSDGDIGNRRL